MASNEDKLYLGMGAIGAVLGLVVGFGVGGIGGSLICAVIGAIIGGIIAAALLPVIAIIYCFGIPILIIIGFLTIAVLLWGVGK